MSEHKVRVKSLLEELTQARQHIDELETDRKWGQDRASRCSEHGGPVLEGTCTADGCTNRLPHSKFPELEAGLAGSKALVERLRKALPDPVKLYTLAEWLDLHDQRRHLVGTEVQDDLRHWAEQAVKVLALTSQQTLAEEEP